MFSKLYIVLAFAIGGFLVGCDTKNVEHWNQPNRIAKIVEIDDRFSIHCDKTTNMAYLVYIYGNQAGITSYLNADGNPARCNEVTR